MVLTWKYAVMYFRLLSMQVRSQASYKASMLMDVISTSLYGLTEIIGILMIVNRLGHISHWTTWEMAFLLAMAEFSFGMMDLIYSGFDPDYFAPAIRRGDFDVFLLRPYPVTLQVLGSRFVMRRLGRILIGFSVMVITLINLKIALTVGICAYMIIIIFSQVTLFGSFFIFGSTITFWTIERIEAVNIITYGGREVITYPMEIFPVWLRQIFTFVIPFIFMNYAPAVFILGKQDMLSLPHYAPFLAPVISGVFTLLTICFWKYGKKHYQSSGT